MRGHPFVLVPRVHTDLSTRRVLVSDYVEGEGFEAVRRADEAQRDRYGEIVFRLHFGLLYRDRIAPRRPPPRQLPAVPRRPGLLPGLRACPLRRPPRASRRSGRSRSPSAKATRRRVKAALIAGGYLPAGRAGRRRRRLCARADAHGDQVVCGARRCRRFSHRRGAPRARARGPDERGAGGDANAGEPVHAAAGSDPDPPYARHRRGRPAQLRAGADWGAIAAEYLHGDPPATPLGQAEADFFRARPSRKCCAGAGRLRDAGLYARGGLCSNIQRRPPAALVRCLPTSDPGSALSANVPAMRSSTLLGAFAAAAAASLAMGASASATKYTECQHPVVTGVEVLSPQPPEQLRRRAQPPCRCIAGRTGTATCAGSTRARADRLAHRC